MRVAKRSGSSRRYPFWIKLSTYVPAGDIPLGAIVTRLAKRERTYPARQDGYTFLELRLIGARGE